MPELHVEIPADRLAGATDTAAALTFKPSRRVPVRRHDAADDRRPDRAVPQPDVAPDAELHRRRRDAADEQGRQRPAPVDDARPQLPPAADVRPRGRPGRHRAHAPRRSAGAVPRCASSTPSRRRAGTRRSSPRGWPLRSTRRRTAAFGRPARTFGEGGTIPFMGMLGEQFPSAQFVVTGALGARQQRSRPGRVPAPPDGPPGHRVHRPPARRPRRLAVALTALVAASPACADDQPASDVVAVEVAAQPCDRPTRDLGVGVLVGPGLVATAAHTVEGPRRQLTVDGSPARVVALDARTDLALLAADIGGTPAEATADDLDRGTVRTPGGDLEVTVLRTGPLVVDDTTAGTRHERTVHTFTPGCRSGHQRGAAPRRSRPPGRHRRAHQPHRRHRLRGHGRRAARPDRQGPRVTRADRVPRLRSPLRAAARRGETSCDVRSSAPWFRSRRSR